MCVSQWWDWLVTHRAYVSTLNRGEVIYLLGATLRPISIKHPRVTPSWSSLQQEMMQALLNYIGCETNKTGPILVRASDKDWLLDALPQLLQVCAPRLWNWEMIICEAQQSTIALSTITQHVHLAMSALHAGRMGRIQRGRRDKLKKELKKKITLPKFWPFYKFIILI